jgi:urease accessory protein
MTFSSPINPAAAATPATASKLDLVFACDPSGKTYISRQYSEYPFHVCRPHYLDAAMPGMATLYFQSCAGGLFEDDVLACSIAAKANAAVHITSQASTIVHSSRRGRPARHSTVIHAGRNAIVEYLPDPTILFSHSRLETRLDVIVDATASVTASDSFILHDPDGENKPAASLTATVCAHGQDGKLLAMDRLSVRGEDLVPGTPGKMGVWSCHGMLMCFTGVVPPAELCQGLRMAVAALPSVYCGVSTLPNNAGAWARFLSGDAASLRTAMHAAWKASRRLLTGHEPANRPK